MTSVESKLADLSRELHEHVCLVNRILHRQTITYRAMLQVISCQPLIEEAGVLSQVSPCAIYGRKSEKQDRGSCEYFGFPPVTFTTILLQTNSFICQRRYRDLSTLQCRYLTKHAVTVGSIWAFSRLNVWTLYKISRRDPFLELSTNLHLSTLSLKSQGVQYENRLSFFNRSNSVHVIN
jgi:hypothetical protein